jgi:hypothetical protein
MKVVCEERKRVAQPRQGHLCGMSRLCTWFPGIELWPLAKLPFDCLEKRIYTALHEDRNDLAMVHLFCSVWIP